VEATNDSKDSNRSKQTLNTMLTVEIQNKERGGDRNIYH